MHRLCYNLSSGLMMPLLPKKVGPNGKTNAGDKSRDDDQGVICSGSTDAWRMMQGTHKERGNSRRREAYDFDWLLLIQTPASLSISTRVQELFFGSLNGQIGDVTAPVRWMIRLLLLLLTASEYAQHLREKNAPYDSAVSWKLKLDSFPATWKNGAGLSSHSRLEKNHHKSYFVCHQSTVNYIRSYFFPLLSSPSILPTMRAVLLFFPATLWSILPYPGARFSPFHLLPQTLSLFASFQMRWKGTLLSVTSIDARTHILLLVGCCGCIKEKEDSLLANQKINFQFKEKEKQITPCTTRLIIRRQNLICYLVTRGYMEP